MPAETASTTKPTMRLALCQIDITVGALDENATKAIEALRQAEAANCEVAVFGELGICGYPPEDLLFKKQFVKDNQQALLRVAAATTNCVAIVGFVDTDNFAKQHPAQATAGTNPQRHSATSQPDLQEFEGNVEVVDPETDDSGQHIYNAVAVCANGVVQAVYRKHKLPNYNVFDEKRYFTAGEDYPLMKLGDRVFGVIICEDLWIDDGPFNTMTEGGAQTILSLNASPYHQHKLEERETLITRRVQEQATSLAYVNLVGGQDELIFDGASIAVSPTGELKARAAQFEEQVVIADLELTEPKNVTLPVTEIVLPTTAAPSKEQKATTSPPPNYVADFLAPNEEIWQALVLGVRDYVQNNNFSTVCIGLSGGIDSAVTTAIAVDALGPENVKPFLMPSRYSSDHSVADAESLCERLKIAPYIVGIEPAHAAFTEMFEPAFGEVMAASGQGIGAAEDETAELVKGLTDQNLQSRIRGVTLMALANNFGWLVLTTGNKSELAVGYSTLYGDSAGAFAAIKDVWKLQVYELARDYNTRAGQEIIPNETIVKAPSAELRPNQKDEDSLPPYEKLDPLLIGLVELNKTAAEMADEGYDIKVAQKISRLVDLAEFKRNQSPIGPRITKRAFGKDRRMPLTHGYHA